MGKWKEHLGVKSRLEKFNLQFTVKGTKQCTHNTLEKASYYETLHGFTRSLCLLRRSLLQTGHGT